MAAGQHKGQKVNVLEECVSNCSVIFLAGFLLGFLQAMLVFLPHITPAAHSSDLDIAPNNQHPILTEAEMISLKNPGERTKESQSDLLLKRQVRILCWVMTANDTKYKLKALAVKQTWGRRCDKILFFAEAEDDEVPMIKIENVQPGRQGLWTKVVGAFKYIHEHHSGEFDWVFRADDDTHAIMDNMREMLLPYDPNKPGYFGYLFQVHVPKGYLSGGGGIVMSKEALKRVVEGAFDGKHKDCENVNSTDAEDDINISQCLYAVGVVPDDSRDFKGRVCMNCFNVDTHLNPDQGDRNWWYWGYLHWNINEGPECCGDHLISWHSITENQHYAHQYLAYNVRVQRVLVVTEANLKGAIPNRKETTTYQPRYTYKDGDFVT